MRGSVLLCICSLVSLELTFLRESECAKDAVHTQRPMCEAKVTQCEHSQRTSQPRGFLCVEESVTKIHPWAESCYRRCLELSHIILSSVFYSSSVKSFISRHSVVVEARHSARDQETAANQTGNTRVLEKLRFMKGQGEAQHRAQICGYLDGRLGSAAGAWGVDRRKLHGAWLQTEFT